MVRRTKPYGGSLFDHDEITTPDAPGAPTYVLDQDGLLSQVIKPHTLQKYERIRQYVEICAAVRRKWKEEFGSEATYVDLYCGPGRAIEEGTGNRFPGSPLLAWEVSCQQYGPGGDTRFTEVFLGDSDKKLLHAATTRLERAGATVTAFHGTAEDNVSNVISQLPEGFHFTLLDPFSLKALPFTVLEQLAAVDHLDMLVHFSEFDLRLNLDFNISGKLATFDPVIPGRRDVIDPGASAKTNRRAVFGKWCGAVQNLRRPVRGFQTVKRRGNVQYYLVLFSQHDLAAKFWTALEASGDQRRFL